MTDCWEKTPIQSSVILSLSKVINHYTHKLPWQGGAKLVSIYDVMLMAFPWLDGFLRQFDEMLTSVDSLGPRDQALNDLALEFFKKRLTMFSGLLRPNGLKTTDALVSDLLTKLSYWRFSLAEFEKEVGQINLTFKAELRSHLFLYLDANKSHFYQKDNPFGDKVAEAFPTASFDLAEASNSYALNRSTACVFHLVRSTEVLKRCMEKHFALKREKNWGAFLSHLRDGIFRLYPDQTSPEHIYFSKMEGDLRSLKSGWRDDCVHEPGTKYTEEEAERAFRIVEGVMKQAVERLKEEKET